MRLEAAERHGQRWARLIALRACGLLALGQGDLAAAASLFEQVVAVPRTRCGRAGTVRQFRSVPSSPGRGRHRQSGCRPVPVGSPVRHRAVLWAVTCGDHPGGGWQWSQPPI